MPNIKVSYRSGLLAGIFSGTIYYIVQSLYVSLQIGVTSYNAIYGSFAALPLFLVWIQIAWIIVLFGSELSFFHQNIATYQYNQHAINLSFVSRTMLAQHIMHSIIARFKQANTLPYSAEQLSIKIQIPISILQALLNQLTECQLLSRIIDPDTQEASYQPAHDVNLLNDQAITEAIENHGDSYEIPKTT